MKQRALAVIIIALLLSLAASTIFVFRPRIDLKDGTELVYRLDTSRFQARIEHDRKRAAAERLKDPKSTIARDLDKRIASRAETLACSDAEAIRFANNIVAPITPADISVHDGKLSVKIPKTASSALDRIKESLVLDANITFHVVVDSESIIDQVRKSEDKRAVVDSVEYHLLEMKSPGTKTSEIVVPVRPSFEATSIKKAAASLSADGRNQWGVDIQFNVPDSFEFGELTEMNLHKRLGIAVGGKFYSAPTIQEPIYERCRISGTFTQSQAESLAAVLAAAELPNQLIFESERKIDK